MDYRLPPKPLKRYPELRGLTLEAQRAGATHVQYLGPAIGFFRPHHDQIERCFAEYSSASKRYEWIWRPPDWREGATLPPDAVPIADFLAGRTRPSLIRSFLDHLLGRR